MTESKDSNTGISNRETARDEERERREHPSVAPDFEDAARPDDERLNEVPNRQTSNKSGTRSIGQKTSESKYATQPAPPSRKTPGAYGKEQDEDPNSEE